MNEIAFLDTVKKGFEKIFCKGDEVDKTYFDFKDYKLKTRNKSALIEQYGEIKEKGLYALIRVSAVIKVGKLAGMRIALGDTRIRGNVVKILMEEGKKLRGRADVFAFTIDTRKECPEATYAKISNWILLKLDDKNTELVKLALEKRDEFRRFLSVLLNFSELNRRANKEITKDNLLNAINKGFLGFNTVDSTILNVAKKLLTSTGVIATIPIIGQIIAIAPIIVAVSNMLFGGVEVMKGTYKTEVFEVIPYNIIGTQATQTTQTRQTARATQQTSPTTQTAQAQQASQTPEVQPLPVREQRRNPFQSPFVLALIGVSMLGFLIFSFWFLFRKRK
ncbi:MAG: hypothetical protein RMJ67_01195 [Elusimicrobiota bacterium]|nr:hypothetical protein [Endomicrobiia bacterium]MDW8165119.1 hypothetical protein [Elusimicrobiota bacterium]